MRVVLAGRDGKRKIIKKKTNSKLLTRPKTNRLKLSRLRQRKRRPKQNPEINVIPVNDVVDVSDYDYDYVDYIYDYDYGDTAPPLKQIPVVPPQPPPPHVSGEVVVPVYGPHDHDPYGAVPVLLHDHPTTHHHHEKPPHYSQS